MEYHKKIVLPCEARVEIVVKETNLENDHVELIMKDLNGGAEMSTVHTDGVESQIQMPTTQQSHVMGSLEIQKDNTPMETGAKLDNTLCTPLDGPNLSPLVGPSKGP